jgi:hypothetical protein
MGDETWRTQTPRALDIYRYKARVQPTAEYKHNFPRSAHRKGRVAGFSNDGKYIYVRLDGNKSARAFHVMYWELVTPHTCRLCGRKTKRMHDCTLRKVGTDDLCEGRAAIEQIFNQY